MYILELFDKKTEELVVEHQLLELKDDDVLDLLGFPLQGNCADLDENQIIKLENVLGRSFNCVGYDAELCEVES
ncbi:hypothetical protein L6J37_05460 [Photobacterium sp. WH77]|uniref:DUF7683 domain-containing protein n=1 Tax=unclassified Photobacterium TaxID=2628852 RepID=UPI001C49740A|nr:MULTISPECIES: hypothetical protein [unclassified Photobacterium]MBV7262417.1 hypothetical protein [Photobacterium sp. WH24]MCG2836309.1 hypothetical protein [Photobacterium sp. WH77]MCG2844064.1 hypothetical protein [Photobacterium sp. WH80]